MENKSELVEQLMEEGKLPLMGEVFSRKAKIAEALRLLREESRKLTIGRSDEKGQQKSLFLYWGVAAMLAVVLGMSGYYFSNEKLMTNSLAAEYSLPDGSKVKLMEHSTLSYNKVSWFWQRTLQLKGKAFFEVTPGKTFIVDTPAGQVAVLGTKFLVEQEGKKMLVDCEEGSVRVTTPVGERMLKAGESVQCDEHEIATVEKVEEEYPEVLGYEGDPLINVVADIEQIFHMNVVGREKCNGLTYDGVILPRDLDATLDKVFGSQGIKYEIRGKDIVLL